MSSSVTPVRRRRAILDDDEEDSDGHSDSLYSGASKRARLDGGYSDAGQPEPPEGSLLPDSYRRSPRGKRRDDHQSGSWSYHPGSIVRVVMINFVTYTKATFNLGPNLNMIIGPNGTGKSSLVCAICLGLGWAASHLGRAKELAEFVKNGSNQAEIRIELAADPERQQANPVITTKITRQGNKSEYYINDKKSSRKAVQALARSFSIQIDNLCQFLPQDRVVEFARLSPVDLLTQTQQAAAPEHMTEMHDDLKNLRRNQKRLQGELGSITDNLKTMENRQRLQEADVIRLRERAKMQERKDALGKMRPFPKYVEARNEYFDARQQYKEADNQLKRLERNLEPNLRAVENKRQYLGSVEKVVKQRQNLVQRSEMTVGELRKKIDTTQAKIKECLDEIENEKKQVKDVRISIPRYQHTLQSTIRAIETPPADFDFAEINEKIREKTRKIREVESKKAEVNDALDTLGHQKRQREENVKAKEREKENLRSQAGQQASKLKQKSAQSARAWDWIQNNRDRFQGPVYGPPLMECRVKDKRHAKAVEAMIPSSEMLAFTVTSQADFKTLQQQLYGDMKLTDVRLRNCAQPLSTFKPTIPQEQLKEYGLDCYVLDLIEGPDAVLAMLCDNRNLHQAAFATHDLTGDAAEHQLEKIMRTSISSWVTLNEIHMITRRREYGDKGCSTRVSQVKNAEIFTDVPVDRQMELDLDRDIREANGEIQQIIDEAAKLVEKRSELGRNINTIKQEQESLEDVKSSKQREFAVYQGLPVKRDQIQRKLDEATSNLAAFYSRRKAIEEQQDEYCLEKGQQAIDLANSVEAQRNLHIHLFESEILRIEAKSDLEQHEAQHAEEQRLLEDTRIEVDGLLRLKDELHAKATATKNECLKLTGEFGEFEKDIYEEIKEWSPDQLETEIQSTQARLEMNMGGGNQNTLREFEKRAKFIEDRRAELEKLQSELQEVDTRITETRERWEPELDALISKISDAFADNFKHIQCAGEVAVHKDEDFENWAIQIRVKFRENENMSILDSQRQSGGERAVSTIFYLMALQSLARAPFRVVDEINQGMDPRNERIVHSRLVDIACAEHTSQYFLITPKVLQGLKYDKNMTVHCIASGEHMPEDHSDLDLPSLVARELAKRDHGLSSGATASDGVF